MKRSGMPARKATPRKREALRLGAEGWEELSIRVLGRDGTRCAWCGEQLRNDADRHHRQRRRDGGDVIENIVIMHSACHHYAHEHVADARRAGIIVPTWADPVETPVDMPGIGWCLLTPEGTRKRVTEL